MKKDKTFEELVSKLEIGLGIDERFLVFCPACQELVPVRCSESLVDTQGGEDSKKIYRVQYGRECSQCGITLFAQVLWRDYPPEGVAEGKGKKGTSQACRDFLAGFP